MENFHVSCSIPSKIMEEKEGPVTKIKFIFEQKDVKDIDIQYSFCAIDVAGVWSPTCRNDRDLKADWFQGMDTMMSISAPVVCFYNNESKNVHTLALSEVKQRVKTSYGVREENGEIIYKVHIHLPEGLFEQEYEIQIWESTDNEYYWTTLQKAVDFWESRENYKALSVPLEARLPLYSFWYSYHQSVDEKNVEAECKEVAKMGFSTIIVDDGWQTEDNHRGYAYCGDWMPSSIKFPDFPAHIKRVQALGLKYMIWFSVPFVGIHAECYERFKDKFLCFKEDAQAGVLDIRYKEVREYLKSIYVRAVKDWGVDGLKLDFIDEFYLRENSPFYNEEMDYTDVQEALSCLLSETLNTLKSIKPDILIEFRQRYIGPEIRQYGNMLRVLDCPDSSLANRVGILDLRLISGKTAVHSDMLMWHPEDTVENAALQVVSCLFSTIQISVQLEKTREDIKEMLNFWLTFMKEHRSLLQESELHPLQPQNLYPIVHVESQEEECVVAYSKNQMISLQNRKEHFYYVHACSEDSLVIEGGKQDTTCQILDCRGRLLENIEVKKYSYVKVNMPKIGLLTCIK